MRPPIRLALLTLTLVVVFALGFGTSVFASLSSQITRLQPFVLDIQQTVPVTLTLSLPSDNGSQTVTVPSMVSAHLTVQIEPSGAFTPVLEIAPAPSPTVLVSAPEPEAASAENLTYLEGGMAAPMDIAGLQMHVTKVRLYDFDEVTTPDAEFADLSTEDVFDGATVLGVISVAITNTADIDLEFRFSHGFVAIGGEQVDLYDYTHLNEDIDGLLMSNITRSTEYHFALKTTTLSELDEQTEFRFRMSRPTNARGNWVDSDVDYEVTIPLTR
jgi:hypothetical protein